jgi:hypothetical protein
MKATHRIGTKDRRGVFVEVEIDADGGLHIIGFTRHHIGADWNSGGQIIDEVASVRNFAPGWTRGRVAQLVNIWRRWHLNHLRAGCEHQRTLGWESYDEHPSEPCPTCGYKYGTAWLKEELPAEVVAWAQQLTA